ncbi:MAG: GNAT family N-acetyltransferase [Bacillota bacterium]|jgi:ribosomal protein S18 acetylase RimI-like enzyme|nr:GNAT family N-acetyltransferase [Bacillota bacterium]
MMEPAHVKGVDYWLTEAANIGIDSLVDLFNDAYSQYYVPTVVTAERLLNLVAREDISMSHSYVALFGSRPVGVVFLGVRGTRGYICGMGVRIAYQGRGVGELLMRRILKEGEALGLDSLQLEVVDRNFRAIGLYAKLGFVPIRVLGVWKRDRMPHRSGSGTSGMRDFDIKRVPSLYVLPLVDGFNEIRPCWQNEPTALAKFYSRLSSYVARAGSDEIAYALYVDTSEGLYIVDFAASPSLHKGVRQGACEALLEKIDLYVPRRMARAHNIPVEDYQGRALRSLGFEIELKQQEMVLCLR